MPRGRKNPNPELRPVEPSNDLNDEQKAKLFIGGVGTLERLIEEKDSVVASIRSQRKAMKAEGFSREEIDYALWLRKDGEEAGKERIAIHLRIAEWLGHPLGFQATLDLVAAQ